MIENNSMVNKYLEKIAGPLAEYTRKAATLIPNDIAEPVMSRIASKSIGVKKDMLSRMTGTVKDVGTVVNTALKK